jgi:hypothetical protein
MLSIERSFNQLQNFIEHEEYRGWDLFDGLNSTVFKKSLFYQSELIRLLWIQVFKRSPVNLRSLARVPKDYNAKGLGLFVSGLIYSGKLNEAKRIMDRLLIMTCPGYDGICWGYNFDWQARAFYVPVGKPNMVTTVFVANAFLDYFDATGDRNALDTGIEACEFILNHLIQFEDKDSLCFAYIPGEKARVHNASMMGAALLVRICTYSKHSDYLEKSRKAMAYSLAALNQDHSWPYGELHHHQFIDSFHTGFNLVALKTWIDFTGEKVWEEKLIPAYRYYIDTFWLDDGCPKYYNNSLYPIDIHCSAQGIVTCLKLAEYDERSIDFAIKIANWTIKNMQDSKGFFYYQKTRFFTNRIPYIRWSQAWMFYAFSLLLSRTNS